MDIDDILLWNIVVLVECVRVELVDVWNLSYLQFFGRFMLTLAKLSPHFPPNRSALWLNKWLNIELLDSHSVFRFGSFLTLRKMPLSIMSRPAPSSWPSVCPVRMYSRPNLCMLNTRFERSIYCLTWLDLLVAFHRQRNIDGELATLEPSHPKLLVSRHLYHIARWASRITSHCQ